jgi:dihydrofolate reductase
LRKIVVSEFVTLDGVMEEPSWTFQFPGDHMRIKSDELFASDALLLGRVTYEGFAAAWPSMEMDPMDYADRMNSLRKYVVSTTLDDAKWNNSKIISENVPEEISKLKNEEG